VEFLPQEQSLKSKDTYTPPQFLLTGYYSRS